MKKNITLLIMIFSFLYCTNIIATVHTGSLEVSTFLGRQQSQKDHNATFCGGVQFGLELVELGIIEFSAETGFGSYPENNQRVRSFDIALKNVFYKGEMFFPHILGGVGLMTYNKTGSMENKDESSVTFAKTTMNFGIGFKIRVKKDFFVKADQKYFLFSKDSDLTYRSLTALGVMYSF